ncbi:hypothetical protein BO85DRAFT_190396 [Aspergillus piperis CBS 112811]|uniref:Uncharacterized protein n=1 Tax=Aspergillus piperis CBS 112811 TaxID=1448313 RepID=A0A8G1RA10_9EURO|nr:hypothetical protein BO85DRAFT_190396 [Aspergillus piperis CBS 112811]RAH61212.1 hypothetical protein BO85DRAFT_190396 [Aspergillus piperis CBS 112811]
MINRENKIKTGWKEHRQESCGPCFAGHCCLPHDPQRLPVTYQRLLEVDSISTVDTNNAVLYKRGRYN